MSAELKKLHGADMTPIDFAMLIELRFTLPSEILRLIHESNSDPTILLEIMRTLVGVRESGDVGFDREQLRQRWRTYQWCVRAMRAWFRGALRKESDAAYAEGKWFSGIGRMKRRATLFQCFALLAWAGVQLRMGMLVNVDDVGRNLIDIASYYYLTA